MKGNIVLLSLFISFASAQNGTGNDTTLRTTVTSTTPTTTTAFMEPDVTTPKPPEVIIKGAGGNCILFSGNVSFEIEYNTVDGMTKTGVIEVPKRVKPTGECTDFTNRLIFSWPLSTTSRNNANARNRIPETPNINPFAEANATGPGSSTNPNRNPNPSGMQPPSTSPNTGLSNMVTLLFIKKPDFSGENITQGSYSLMAVFGTVVADFPDAEPGQQFRFQSRPTTEISTQIESPYSCQSRQEILPDATGKAKLILSDIMLQAFQVNSTMTDFTSEVEPTLCAADGINAGSIAAFVLLGIVLLVAAGYIIQKYRKGRGYESV